MYIAWTTVPTKLIAEELAAAAISEQRAVCVQVDGPITSFYIWEGASEKAEEYRMTFKILPIQLQSLKTWIHTRHPYQTPQWVVVKAEYVAEKYLSWAQASSSNLTL